MQTGQKKRGLRQKFNVHEAQLKFRVTHLTVGEMTRQEQHMR